MMKKLCPNCKTVTDYSANNPFRPFCSERCRMIDLGDWLMENNSIPVNEDSVFEDQANKPVKH